MQQVDSYNFPSAQQFREVPMRFVKNSEFKGSSSALETEIKEIKVYHEQWSTKWTAISCNGKRDT